MKWIYLPLTLVLVFTCLPLTAKETINSLYKAYQEQLAENNKRGALESIKKAFYLSKEQIGMDNQTTQVLLQNYALLYVAVGNRVQNEDDDKYIAELMKDSIDSIKDIEGDKSLSLIDPLMTLASVYLGSRNGRRAVNRLNEAIEIAKQHTETHPGLYAGLNHEAAIILLNKNDGLKAAKSFAKKAYDSYKQLTPDGSEPLAESLFTLAKVNMQTRDYEESNQYFSELLNQHEQAGVTEHPRVSQTYAMMVHNYEKLDQSDKATIYLRKIGQSKPWDDNQQQTPLYLLEPSVSGLMPRGISKVGGTNRNKSSYSRFKMTIDENGFVSDFELVDSSGNKKFSKAVEEVLPKWRFAPKFVDGKPVAAEIFYTFEYKVE